MRATRDTYTPAPIQLEVLSECLHRNSEESCQEMASLALAVSESDVLESALALAVPESDFLESATNRGCMHQTRTHGLDRLVGGARVERGGARANMAGACRCVVEMMRQRIANIASRRRNIARPNLSIWRQE